MVEPWVLITVALIAIIPGIATFIQGVRTHRTFNSKMDAMLELVAKSSFAEGEKSAADKAAAIVTLLDEDRRSR